jgi:flagellar motor protein MotB
VSEQRYDALQGAYTQLQGRYTADEATIQMLDGRLRITMTDRILFSSGGSRINERAREALAKMVPTLQVLTRRRSAPSCAARASQPISISRPAAPTRWPTA